MGRRCPPPEGIVQTNAGDRSRMSLHHSNDACAVGRAMAISCVLLLVLVVTALAQPAVPSENANASISASSRPALKPAMVFTFFMVLLGPMKLLGPLARMTAEMDESAARSPMPPLFESSKHLCHSGPANSQIAGKGRTTLELSCVEKRLVIEGEFERIAAFYRSRLWLRYLVDGTVPGENGDHGRST
jgi:hypothetical protein